MRKMHSPGKPYPGMPILDYFCISTADDYKNSLRATASRLRTREDYESYVAANYKRFYFRHSIDRAVSGATDVLFLSVGDAWQEYYFLNKYRDKRITISDIDPSMLAKIKEYTVSNNCTTLVSDSLNVPVPDASYDAVCVLGAEYFYDNRQLLAMLYEMNRILKDNGRLYMGSYSLISPGAGWVRDFLLTLLNQSTLIAIAANLLLRSRLVAFSGYMRCIHDFEKVFSRSPLRLTQIEFEGGSKEPGIGVPAALFTLTKP